MIHFEFLLHVAAIPLEILMGAIVVERFLARKAKEAKLYQLMYIKSYIFRTEMRNVFISNFEALAYPEISMIQMRKSSLEELKKMRKSVDKLRYRSLEELEPVIMEYVRANQAFRGFMEWALANEMENIFADMIYILHFIQDVKLFKEHNPDKLFVMEAEKQPQLKEKMDKVLKDGICKFLDYAIELKEKQSQVFEELLTDYHTSSAVMSR